MSEVITTPPPPPPPPPPQPPKVGFDFVRPFAFVFEDARWLNKVLIGGVFQILSFILVGIPFVLGYLAVLVRNVVADQPQPLPEWDDLGDKFAEGLRLVGIGIVYIIPMFALIGVIIVPAVMMGVIAQHHGNSDFDPGGLIGCFGCLAGPLGLLYALWVPAAMLNAMVEQRFGAAFDFHRIWAFISNNIGNYLLAVVVMFVARFAASFGVILFCVGVVFTIFWAMLVTFYAFAQAWRLATVK